MKNNILITGSSGNLGNYILEYFIKYNDFNKNNIIALTRDELKLEKFKEKGIIIKNGDYNDLNSLINAFKDIDKLIFIASSDLKCRNNQHENIIKAAKISNVKYIAYTSFIRNDESKTSPINFILDSVCHTEKIIIESGIPYTFFVNGLYSEGITDYFFKDVLKHNEILFPAGNGIVNYICREDIAKGIVKVMLNNTNKYFFVKLSFNSINKYNLYDVANIISKITKKDIKYNDCSIEYYRNTLKTYGYDDNTINFNIGFALAIKNGNFYSTKSDLDDILNRDTITLEQFLLNYYNTK